MKILYQIPSLNTIYAGRTIYFGYKNAFEEKGHIFKPLTADDDPNEIFKVFKPNILITGLSSYCLKFLPPETIKKQKKYGMKVFVNTSFWKSPISKFRVNEVGSISENKYFRSLITSGNYGDVFFNICEQGDPRMDGFEKETGYKPQTILLAADKTVIFPEFSEKFISDIAYIGTYLPGKAKFIKNYVFPLKKRYNVKLYGQDWILRDRVLGLFQKAGQYYNIPFIKNVQKPKLALEDERKIYSSSKVSLNFHEDYQKQFLGDINERTFKIPLAGGFEIVDNVPSLPKYFIDGKDLVIAKNKKDWFDKIDFYIKNPKNRSHIIEQGIKKVLKNHTYHNRVDQIIKIYNNLD